MHHEGSYPTKSMDKNVSLYGKGVKNKIFVRRTGWSSLNLACRFGCPKFALLNALQIWDGFYPAYDQDF